jgi:hypothetical protein
MKKILFLLVLLCGTIVATSCPVCEKQQPEILKGITHGAGPQSDWDYVIVWVVAIIAVATLFFSVKWLIRPGEKGAGHIKRTVLNHQ